MPLTTTFYTYLVIHYQITLGSSAALLVIAEEVQFWQQMNLKVCNCFWIIIKISCVFLLTVIGLAGNRNSYGQGDTARVTCFSNFTVVSIQWTTSSKEVSVTTEKTSDNELYLEIEITNKTHDTMFTCEVINLLPNNRVRSTISFTIKTQQECKIYDYFMWHNIAVYTNCT